MKLQEVRRLYSKVNGKRGREQSSFKDVKTVDLS